MTVSTIMMRKNEFVDTVDSFDEVSSVGSQAPTLGTRMTACTTSARLEDKYIHTKSKRDDTDDDDDGDDISSVGSGAPTLSTKKNSPKAVITGTTDDVSTVGSQAPTLGTRMTVCTTSAKLEDKFIIDTTSQRHCKDDDVSSVGSGAPTLFTKKTRESCLTGSLLEENDYIVDGDGNATDGVSTGSAMAPTFSTNWSTRSRIVATSEKDNCVDTTALLEKDSPNDSGAPGLSNTTMSVFTSSVLKNQSVLVGASGETDVSTVGSNAPTLGTRMTTKSSCATGFLEGKKVIDASGKMDDEDDVSSVGSDAPTLSSKKTTKSTLTASTHKNQFIETEGAEDDISTVGSEAPTVVTRTTTQSSFTASILEDKLINTKGEADDISTVGSFAPTLNCTSSRKRAVKSKNDVKASNVSMNKNHPTEQHKSDMGLLSGLLGRESLSSALEVVVGNFLRRGACAGIAIWLVLILIIICVAPYDSYQVLGFNEWVAHFMTLVVLIGANFTRLSPYLVRERSWEFLKGGAMASNAAVQMIAITSVTMMLVLPTPVLVDPITGLRSHLIRWAEWTALAFLMTFLTESIDLPLEDGDTRVSWIHGANLALSTLAGGILPFCTSLTAWLCVFTISWTLFCSLFVRLYQRGRRLRTISSGDTIVEKEEYTRAKYAFKLMVICTILWTLLALSWSLCCLAPRYAAPGSLLASDWLVLAVEDVFQVLSKVGYLSVLLEVHEEIFDEDSKTVGRLQELRNYMSAVWDASSDVVVICSSHDHMVNAAISPAFAKLENSLRGTTTCEKNTSSSSSMTLVMEVDPYDGSFRTFELDLTKKTTRDEACTMLKNYRNRTRFVTPTGEKNLAVLADLICDACTCGIQEGQDVNVMKKDFYAIDKDEKEAKLFCEAKVTRAQGKAVVLVLRDVSQRYQLLEAKKQLVKEITLREKICVANHFTRHKVKEEALGAIDLCASLKETFVKNEPETSEVSRSDRTDDVTTASSDKKLVLLDNALQTICNSVTDHEEKDSS